MTQKTQLFLFTVFIIFAICLIIHLFFQSSVLDATVVEDGITRIAYCFLERQLLIVFTVISITCFVLGIWWGEFLTLNYPIENDKASSSLNKVQ